MGKIFVVSFISFFVTLISVWGVYNYLPVEILELLQKSQDQRYGATITNIAGTDTLKDSRAVSNTNFTNLNTDKIEVATTSVGNITALANLVTVGTITTGRWNGSIIQGTYGGTGTSTFPAYHVIIASSTGNGLMTVSGLGTSGQFLTSQGAGASPQWTTSSINQALNYTWTGEHTFRGATTTTGFFASSTTLELHATNLNASSTATLNTTIIQGNLTLNRGCTGCFATSTYLSANELRIDDTYQASIAATTTLFSNGRTTPAVVPTIDFGTNDTWWAAGQAVVPKGATGISAIRVFYKRDENADLLLSFRTGHFKTQAGSLPFTIETDTSEFEVVYSTGGSGGGVAAITVNAAAYGALTGVREGDIVSIEFGRNGGAAADTYAGVWYVYGVSFDWN